MATIHDGHAQELALQIQRALDLLDETTVGEELTGSFAAARERLTDELLALQASGYATPASATPRP